MRCVTWSRAYGGPGVSDARPHRLSKLLFATTSVSRTAPRGPDVIATGSRRSRWTGRPRRRRCFDARGGSDALCDRRDQLGREIIALLPASPWQVHIGRLRCLRGIDTLTAVGLCAEIGDFERFASAEQLTSYVGLVPSESSSGRAGSARSPRADPATPAGYSSRPHGTTEPARTSARRSATATTASRPKRSRSPGQPNDACTEHGRGSRHARNAPRSSPSPPPASSPASAGQSPASNNTTTQEPDLSRPRCPA